MQRREELLKVFEEDLVEVIFKSFEAGKVCEKMPMNMVEHKSLWGTTDEKKDAVKSGVVSSKRKYGDAGLNRQGNRMYEIEITFRDNFVTGWKEL